MAKTNKYDAFISYRHCEPDSGIAARLQKKLEGFRLPKEIAKKIGRPKLNRVFRDETEFAVADDLTQAIDEALANSEYLICICSPAYLQSSWCRKEIQSFLRLHDRKHILLVLADGEPMDAFPPEVIYDDVLKVGADGNPYWTKVLREPLAADCRGGDEKERITKMDKAVLRLIAAILDIGFDDLQQRHRQEQYKQTRSRVLIVFGVLVAFLGLAIGFLIRIAGQNVEILSQNEEIARQNEEISRQNGIITLKYADTLAATSDNLLRDGKRTDAVYAARLALSDEKTDNYSELATKALVHALDIYDLPDSFGCDSDVLLPCSVLSELVVSSNGRYASLKDLERVRYIVDMESGETVMSFEENDYASFIFDGEKGCVFKRQDNKYAYYDFATGTETGLGINDVYLYSNIEGEGYAIRSGDILKVFNGSNAIWSVNFPAEGFSDVGRLEITVTFINDTSECWILVTDYDYQTTSAFIVDMESGSSRRMLIANNVCFNFVTDGKSVVWTQPDNGDNSLHIMDVNSGRTDSMTVSSTIYDLAVRNDDVVTISNTAVTVFNTNLNEITWFETKDYTRIVVSGDAIYLLDSTCRLYKIQDGAYDCYDTIPTDSVYSWMLVFRNGKLYAALTGDNHIYTYSFRQSDYMTVTSTDFEALEYDYYDQGFIDLNPAALAFVNLIMQSETEFQENRIRRVVMCENADMGVVQLYDGAVHIYNSTTGEKIKTIYSIEGSVNKFYYDQNIGYYYLSSSNVDVYDENFKNIYSIRNCMLGGIEKQSGAIVVYDLSNGIEGSDTTYSAYPVTYEQLISMADEFLDGYEPDERVKEKYSLG